MLDRLANIVVIGSANTDMVVRTPYIPAPGETILGHDFQLLPGGKGANQAVAAARLGANVTFVACIGSDVFGNKCLENLKGEGINIDFISRHETEPSGIALICVGEDAQNSIIVASGSNAKLGKENIDLARKAIERADIVLLQLEIPMETVQYAVEFAHAAKVKVILNPAPAQPLPDDLLSKVNVLTPNEVEASAIARLDLESIVDLTAIANKLLDTGVQNVIVTMGQSGAYVQNSSTTYSIPGIPVEAVDTTAAGDCFCGALAVGLSEGMDMDVAVRFANSAASLSVTKFGAQPSMPFRNEVEKQMSLYN